MGPRWPNYISGMGTTDGRTPLAYRWPWFWLVVLAALAMAGTVAILVSSRSRLHAIDDNFASSQMVRLQRVEHRIDQYFACANQLVLTASRFANDTVGDERTIRWLLARTFLARRDSQVYGLGVFYAPGAFDSRLRFVSFYDHEPADEVVRTSSVADGDYRSSLWYRSAVSQQGGVAYAGPFRAYGRSYISVLQAFYRNGKLLGIASVDTRTDQFREMLMSGTRDGDVAWISRPRQGALVSTRPVPADAARYRDAALHLDYSRAMVHLTSDAKPLLAAHRETVTTAAVAVAVLWIFAGCAAVFLVGRWRATAAALASRAEQIRLEDEIAVAKRVEAELRKAAFTDALTGLPNRAAFLEAGARVLVAGPGAHAVFLVDLDRFNITNETLGHPAGDELLRILATRLAARVGPEGFVARLGGDEYVLLLPCAADRVYRTGELLLRSIAEPAVLYGRTIYPQASIGIATVDASYHSAEELLRDADIAMYAAKNRGRARCALFDTEMRRQIALDAELEMDLRRAIEHGDIVPHFQPIVEIASRKITSFEALARWQRSGSLISASQFVPFSESRGFVYQIDAAIQRATLSNAKRILAQFPGSAIALNVSAPELTSPLFAKQLRSLLDEYGVEPQCVRLEITETTMMTRADEAHKTLKALAELGISVVLDDFGTGYSSLSYLQRLPISGLKIDRSFVAEIDTDERSREIVRSIVALAHVLGLTTTAEGVERAAQIDELTMLGVTYGQGFFFSPPIALAQLGELAIVDERRVANAGE